MPINKSKNYIIGSEIEDSILTLYDGKKLVNISLYSVYAGFRMGQFLKTRKFIKHKVWKSKSNKKVEKSRKKKSRIEKLYELPEKEK